MKVMKFGGGCLKDSVDFQKAGRILCDETEKTVVVVSAVYGVTDLICDAVNSALNTEHTIPSLIKSIMAKHKKIVEQTIKNKDIYNITWNEIMSRLKRMERLLFGVAYSEEISDSLMSLIHSYGERICASLLAGVLMDMGIMAQALDSDTIGLITDDYYANATAVLPEIRRNLTKTIKPLMEKNIIPIITGYFGCSRDGKVTTFGRNGSDYSAAVIAYGIEASSIEIWKEVNGFMTADPRIVKDAQRIESLSYYEAAELSYFGAKILHPRTVEPLKDLPIPILIRNINDSFMEGTKLLAESSERKNGVKSVTFNREISIVKIHGPGVGFKPGILGDLGHALGNRRINIYSVITSQTQINLIIDKKDQNAAFESLSSLSGGIIEKVEVENTVALVAVVGKGIQSRKGIAAKVFSAVASENINIKMISSGASEVAYYFLVKEDDVGRAVQAIHHEFF
ncbi:MAG: aspartate kinase [Candidatus Aminicenantes bacterium]|nr:aspartate kinase [Candidatus Aminicenantes bacterium]